MTFEEKRRVFQSTPTMPQRNTQQRQQVESMPESGHEESNIRDSGEHVDEDVKLPDGVEVDDDEDEELRSISHTRKRFFGLCPWSLLKKNQCDIQFPRWFKLVC